MKKSKSIWNYLDMLSQILLISIIIIGFYYIAESLERYIYRYTIFPFIALILIFVLGALVGRGVERTKHNKPIGIISKKMQRARKRKNMFIFSDDGETYVPHKEIIEEIKSGEIVHVKQFQDSNIDIEEFNEIYKIQMDNIVDDKMDEVKENEENKE